VEIRALTSPGTKLVFDRPIDIKALNAELNPICHLLALLGAHHIFHVSRIRVKNNFSCWLDTDALSKNSPIPTRKKENFVIIFATYALLYT